MGNTETALKFRDLKVDRSKGEVHEDWNVSPGKLRGSSVTVFSAVHPPSSRKRPFMEKALQASKVYRHPAILRYLDGGVLDSEIIIVTEQATPLLFHGLDNISLLQITAGLASIIEALVFLHDKAGVSHNNVCASSIYVTSEGIWKLWGLEYLCSFGDLTRDHIERINQYCNEKNIPPDDKSRISPAYQHARDCYFFGKLIEDIITPALNIDVAMVGEFLGFIEKKALHREWSERPRLSSFSEYSLFQQEFLKLRHDVANILLLPVDQRDEFIRSLPTTLKNYSDGVVASTLGSLLLSHSFLLIPSSASHLMPCLLTPKSSTSDVGLFSPSVFKEAIVPLILHLFSIHDAAIRKVLLNHFEQYARLIQKEQLSSCILPQILLGIRDTDEELVESTLHCLACLIPLLGADIVIGRNREQIFATAKPKTKFTGVIGKVNMKRRKKSLLEPPVLVAPNEVDGSSPASREESSDQNTTSEVHTLVSESAEVSLDIPERSSPDGGEMTDDDLFIKKKEMIATMDGSAESPLEEQWSDWEEMLDQPTPDIVGVLEVKTPETEVVNFDDLKVDASVEDTVNSITTTDSFSFKPITEMMPESSSKEEDSSFKGSAMQLKAKRAPKVSRAQGLGEEYDIMSIKIVKKPDAERDFFADLVPKLLTKDYNLETMLLEASHKTREKFPSLSDTLAELDVGGIEEGEDWNEEGNWSPEDPHSANLSDAKGSVYNDSLTTQNDLYSSSVKVANISQANLEKESSLIDDGWGQEKWDSF